MKRYKIIIIVGPNACGKSSLAIKLAKKFKGEIVSADSRQIYQGLDLGSGKVTKTEQKTIPHHLLDIVKPNTQFSLAQWQKRAFTALDSIIQKGKLPFLVGGTGLYIQAISDNLNIPKIKPNRKLRRELERLTLQKLQTRYKKCDPIGFRQIDLNNPRRLIRAIEVSELSGQPFWAQRQKQQPKYDCLKLGVTFPKAILDQRIKTRLAKRLRQGMVKEVDNLLRSGVKYKRLYNFGLEYRRITQYLKGELTYQQMEELLYRDICRYAKRQMTWFKRDKEIIWLKNQQYAKKLIKKFI